MLDETLCRQLLEALHATFGPHPGFRVTHAKGVVARGFFTASSMARRVSRAEHFQGAPVAVLARFSSFSGIPSTHDSDPTASPRGLGLRFYPSAQTFTDIVAHSYDGFPVASPEDFLHFLRGIAASEARSPDPRPLASFLSDHPIARRYLDAPKPATASYVAERYYGVNAFRFDNREGVASYGRYRIDPTVCEPPLNDAVARARSADFLSDELTSRLSQGPVRLRMILQLAATGDDLSDGSVSWPHTGPNARQEAELGFITLESVETASAAAGGRGLAMSPANLIEGITPSNDPMIPLRDRVYQLAAARRLQGPS